MYKMITTSLLCMAAVVLKAQNTPIDSVSAKSSNLGATSTIYTNDLTKYQSATILTGLQGRLKGLNVSPFRGMMLLRTDANTSSDIVGAIPNVGGGIYGDNSEFLISARGQSPVAIVDGVERAHRALSAFSLVHFLHHEEARKGGVRNIFGNFSCKVSG